MLYFRSPKGRGETDLVPVIKVNASAIKQKGFSGGVEIPQNVYEQESAGVCLQPGKEKELPTLVEIIR